jgi:hyaluronoglucosaminidase
MNTSPFAVRGVVEGFYGPPYTFPQRDDLISWMGGRGYNLYIYGPKNDRQHRNRWREPYPEAIMARFGATVRAATAAGVTFCYALSPSVSMRYACPEDFAALTAKLEAFYRLGVRAFAIFFDDIDAAFRHPEDVVAFPSVAEAHADVCNRAHAWLQARDPACTLSMCPTDYYGAAPFSAYLWSLGERLDPAIEVFYTGPAICSPTITAGDALAFAAALRRRPIIWDNYPVNDLAMKGELHLGPVSGRDPRLAEAARGIVVNPMLQPEASKVALATYADFLAAPHAYEPVASWVRALDGVAGSASLYAFLRFAESSLHSDLSGPDAPYLARFVDEALAALRRGELAGDSPAVGVLAAYLDDLDEASYHLKNRMENLLLRADLLPWLELCDLWLDASRRAVRALYAEGRGEPVAVLVRELREYLDAAVTHHKRYAGRVLEPFNRYVLEGFHAEIGQGR